MAQQFPADARARLEGGAMSVLDAEGACVYAVDLRWLADRLQRGETCNAKERGAAGFAITYLLERALSAD